MMRTATRIAIFSAVFVVGGGGSCLSSKRASLAPQGDQSKMVMSEQQEGSIHSKLEVSLEGASGEAGTIQVSFSVRSAPGSVQKIVFPSGQEYDFQLLDETGRSLWQWSKGRMFTMMVQEKNLSDSGWLYSAIIPLKDDSGQRLKPGLYRVRAVLVGNPAHQHQIDWELPGS